MSDIWTAAQDAENDADAALEQCAFCECPENDAALKALALAAAVACEAVASAENETAVECEGSLLLRETAEAIAADYSARAVRWRKIATEGETT